MQHSVREVYFEGTDYSAQLLWVEHALNNRLQVSLYKYGIDEAVKHVDGTSDAFGDPRLELELVQSALIQAGNDLMREANKLADLAIKFPFVSSDKLNRNGSEQENS